MKLLRSQRKDQIEYHINILQRSIISHIRNIDFIIIIFGAAALEGHGPHQRLQDRLVYR